MSEKPNKQAELYVTLYVYNFTKTQREIVDSGFLDKPMPARLASTWATVFPHETDDKDSLKKIALQLKQWIDTVNISLLERRQAVEKICDPIEFRSSKMVVASRKIHGIMTDVAITSKPTKTKGETEHRLIINPAAVYFDGEAVVNEYFGETRLCVNFSISESTTHTNSYYRLKGNARRKDIWVGIDILNYRLVICDSKEQCEDFMRSIASHTDIFTEITTEYG